MAFLGWLRQRRPDRPFFAFLNYFDAHEPYIPPPGYAGRSGISPKPPRDYQFLIDYMAMDKSSITKRDIQMARDCYDDCIAFLDEQLGWLLDEIRRQGLLDNTVVIITADHGEAFGDHDLFGHATGAHLDEIGVPLVILSPGAPAGRVVDSPVSLRDLPATVLDQLRLSADSPFPGRSLSAYWRSDPGAYLKEPPAQLSPSMLARSSSNLRLRVAAGTVSSRCPWWPSIIITSGMVWGPRGSTICGKIRSNLSI